MWWTIRREKMRTALFLPSSETQGQSVGSEEKSGATFAEDVFLPFPSRSSLSPFSPLPSLPATQAGLFSGVKISQALCEI